MHFESLISYGCSCSISRGLWACKDAHRLCGIDFLFLLYKMNLFTFFCSHVSVATSFPHCLTSFHVPHSFEMEINHTGEYPEGASCYTQNVAFGTAFHHQDTGEISNFNCYRARLHRSLGYRHSKTVLLRFGIRRSLAPWCTGMQHPLSNCSSVKFHFLPLINSASSHFHGKSGHFLQCFYCLLTLQQNMSYFTAWLRKYKQSNHINFNHSWFTALTSTFCMTGGWLCLANCAGFVSINKTFWECGIFILPQMSRSVFYCLGNDMKVQHLEHASLAYRWEPGNRTD